MAYFPIERYGAHKTKIRGIHRNRHTEKAKELEGAIYRQFDRHRKQSELISL
jgi:hypothetical protein